MAARIVCRGASFEFNFLKGGYVPPGIFSNASVIPRNCWVNYILYPKKNYSFPKRNNNTRQRLDRHGFIL